MQGKRKPRGGCREIPSCPVRSPRRPRAVRPGPLEQFDQELVADVQRELHQAREIERLLGSGIKGRELVSATGFTPMQVHFALLRLNRATAALDRIHPPAPPSPEQEMDDAKWRAIQGPDGVDQLLKAGVCRATWQALIGGGLWRLADVEEASDAALLKLRYVGARRVRTIRDALARLRVDGQIAELENQFQPGGER